MITIDIFWSTFKILLALFLVFLNAFFVAAEFSLVKVRKTRLAELSEGGSHKAGVALEVTSKLDAYLSACQLGITLASLGLGWLGEPAVATLLEPLFAKIPGWTPVFSQTVAFIIAFLIITFLHIVLGELIPKSLAIQKAEQTALAAAGWLRLFYKLLYPAIWALNGIANKTLGIWGIEPANEADMAHSPEELRLLVESSQRHGYLDKMEGNLLDNVFDFTDRIARDVMVPRQDMVCLYTDDSIEKAREVVKNYGHVRYPLCEEDKDNVVGMIHIRDLINVKDDPGITELAQLKRNILIVPETMPIPHLVQRMRSQRVHMAIVADEFGGTAGLVTIEDILEELVGEIYDEFELEQPLVVKTGDKEYEFHGRVLLDDVSEVLNIDFEEEEVSTIGGYIFSRLGRIPKQGDQVERENYTFEVTQMSGRRITKVKATGKQTTADVHREGEK